MSKSTQLSIVNGSAASDVVVGGGEMGELIRGLDWSKTPLGPIERWPQSLRSALSICLPSKAQIALCWGEDLITLYNDAYRPVFGAKHPSALGKPLREAWDELWRAGLKEIFDGVLTTGEAFWAQDRPFFMERYGYPEETYFDVSYDPVRDESGRVGGVFCIVSETTGRVIGERRLRALRDLGYISQRARRVADVYSAAAEVLSRYAEDLPVALLYGPHETAGVELLVRVGLADGSRAAPAHMSTSTALWPLSSEVVVLQDDDLAAIASLHAGPWPEPIRQAVILPFVALGQTAPSYLIAGISPRRKLDDGYLDFLRLVVGNLAGAIASARKVEDEHRRAEMLAELDRAKTTFFSNVSHELRTPLTLILGPVEQLLQGSHLDPEARRLLTFVNRSSMRLLKLVNTLLDFARLEGGRLQAEYEPTDLALLTTELASTFRSAMESAGLAFEVHCHVLSNPVYVDREMWEKIVLNLLSNAFKFTLQGKVSVHLSETSEGVEFQVRDSGTGIPATEVPRLFQRFYRVPNASGRSNEGTGIGLALVNELVKLHGGTISARSEEGRGTTFTISLPFGCEHLPADQVRPARDSAPRSNVVTAFLEEIRAWQGSAGIDEIADLHSTQAPSGTSAAPSERYKVLLADDNADMREYVRHLIGQQFDLTTACDGLEALDLIRKEPPDLVLSDVMMPKMDGMALLNTLRADPATVDIPVILLSARAGEEARVEGLNVGADDYLIKPFSARELVARIDAHVRLSQMRRRAQQALQEAEEMRWRVAHEQMRVQLGELQRIFENTPSFMAVLTGDDLVFELINPAYEKLIDYRPVLGKPLLEGMPELIDQPYPKLLKRVMETGEPFIGREMPVTLRAEDTAFPVQRYVDFVYMPLIGGGIQPAVLVEGNDVTDRVQAKRQLEDANKRKDEFLATLAHELRNPLAALSSAAQLLIRAEQKPAIAAVARDALTRQVEQMARLLDDLLDLGRITHGRVHLRKALMPLEEAIDAAIETSRPIFEAKRHSLTVERPELSVCVDADRVRLAQIFTNLLTNAAKYTDPEGSIVVSIERADERARVTVSDTGIGLSNEALARVFEMFSQLKPAIERSEGGLGIGLALVKGLVELHGGRVYARSAGLGHGAQFTVELPLAERQIAEASQEQSDRTTPHSDFHSRKVLITDDNKDTARSWAALLELEGCQTRTAFSASEAMRVVEEFQPDVALLDIGMPDINGYELARMLRSTPLGRKLFLVAITGWGQQQDKFKAHEAGFDAHLTKPVNLPQIIALMDERLGDTPGQ
ncbi:MAG TPA: ATP-binding protein [Steroidobacteraceae bacterium]|nr:ATP-binding protein [Steroidobacteraceae bacterium]